MSTVTPPSPQPPPQTATAATASAVTVPPDLADLAVGSKIDALLLRFLDNGQVLVQTQFGETTLKLGAGAITAKPGQALILQILAGGPQPRFSLIPAAGQGAGSPLGLSGQGPAGQVSPQGLGTASGATSAAQGGQVAATPATGAPVTVQVGGTLTAVLLRPFSLPAGVSPLGPQTIGTPVTSTAGAPAGPATHGAPASGSPTPSAAAAVGGPQAGASLPAGSTLDVRVLTIRSPEGANPPLTLSGPPGPLSLAPGTTLQGVVSGRVGIAQTVVQTHAGPIALPTGEPLPPGTRIELAVVQPPRPPAPGATPHAWNGVSPDGDWPALDEAAEALEEISPGALRHALSAATPKADQQLASNLLFFLSALKGGDIRGWLGDGPLRILERHRPDLAGRLRDDFGQLGGPVRDPESGDWRLQMVPFLNGQDIERIRVMTREKEEGEKPGDTGGTRFVIDLDLSRLGHFQIDGLVGMKGKRVDLMVRTDEPLEPHMREDIRRIFSDAAELTGIEGSVGFQAAPGNFVNVPRRGRDPLAPLPAGVVI